MARESFSDAVRCLSDILLMALFTLDYVNGTISVTVDAVMDAYSFLVRVAGDGGAGRHVAANTAGFSTGFAANVRPNKVNVSSDKTVFKVWWSSEGYRQSVVGGRFLA